MRGAAIVVALALGVFARSGWASDVGGGWTVSPTSEQGKSSGCIAVGPDHDDTKLAVYVDQGFQWSLIFSNNEWKLPVNQQTAAATHIDRHFLARGLATSISPTALSLPVDGSSKYAAVQMGAEIELKTPESELTVDLKGAAPAMIALLDCVRDANRQVQPVPPKQGQPAQASQVQVVPVAETTVMLTNLLNSAGVQGFRLLPPASNSIDAEYSLPDGTSGALEAFRGASITEAENEVAYVISQLSQACKGDFRSAKTSVPTDDGSLIRKIGTTCSAGGSVIATNTTLIRHPDGFVVQLVEMVPYQSSGLPVAKADSQGTSALVNAAMQLPDTQR